LVQSAHTLVTWYQQHKRPLPWRLTQDPYAILVSETMLQQTRVDTVIPFYHAFLASFPTIAALAAADEDTVLKHWQGLGYYSRARNLHRAAKQIATQHAGLIPADVAAVSALPGVGPYTCGAVMSIAFDQPVPAVDGNVLRVFARYLGIRTAIEKPLVKQQIQAAVAVWLAETRPADLTQAIMELGALVCVPKAPKCTACPIAVGCIARTENLTDVLPVREKKKPRKVKHIAAMWLELEHELWIEQRTESGLLSQMWQLPSVEAEDPETAKVGLTRRLVDFIAQSGPSLAVRDANLQVATSADFAWVHLSQEKHIFTHLEWYVDVYRPVGIELAHLVNLKDGNAGAYANMRWVPKSELSARVFPRVYEKVLESILGERVR